MAITNRNSFGRSDIPLSEQGTDLSRWYPHGTPAKEKKLLTKIDFFILTWASLSYFSKNLNTNNVSKSKVAKVE